EVTAMRRVLVMLGIALAGVVLVPLSAYAVEVATNADDADAAGSGILAVVGLAALGIGVPVTLAFWVALVARDGGITDHRGTRDDGPKASALSEAGATRP